MFIIGLFVFNLAQAKVTTYKEDIRVAVKDHHGKFKKCYDIALAKNPKLVGRVIMEWDVDDEGKIYNPEVISSNAKSEEFDTCMKATLETVILPPAPKKQIIHMKYPFSFGKFR